MLLIVFLLWSFLGFAVPNLLQLRTDEKAVNIYQQIPAEQRRPLTEALENLIAAERTGDWKSVYELADKRPHETEEKFVKKMKSGKTLREFRPSKVTFMPPDGSWNIQGCASFQGDPNQRGHIADVTARWTGSRWYLSPVAFVLFGDENRANLRDCSVPNI